MGEGFIVVIPVTLLSLAILITWFFKGRGSNQVKWISLAVYVFVGLALFALFDNFFSLLWLMLVGFILPILFSYFKDRNAV
ncbi:hypothetical protein [Aliiglaciecola litoralis]|uniref:Uncharacterized protein n=1 Tax=Aliiglaciecola litoralis TaxID=582857 RepID=A0ABP3X7T3_9ALTE